MVTIEPIGLIIESLKELYYQINLLTPSPSQAQLDIELEETSHGTTNPTFTEPDFDNV